MAKSLRGGRIIVSKDFGQHKLKIKCLKRSRFNVLFKVTLSSKNFTITSEDTAALSNFYEIIQAIEEDPFKTLAARWKTHNVMSVSPNKLELSVVGGRQFYFITNGDDLLKNTIKAVKENLSLNTVIALN